MKQAGECVRTETTTSDLSSVSFISPKQERKLSELQFKGKLHIFYISKTVYRYWGVQPQNIIH